MKMKKLLALLLSVCVLGGLVACGGDTDAGDNTGASENAGTVADNTEVDLPVSGKTMQDFVAEYDNICTATYVDSYFGFCVDYPAYITALDSPTKDGRTDYFDLDVYIRRESDYTLIASILDTNDNYSNSSIAFKIYYPWTPQIDSTENDDALAYSNAKDFYDNYYKNMLDLSEEKHLNSYEFNSLCWEEYEFTYSDGSKSRNFITVKDNIPFVLNFKLLDTYEGFPITEEQWTEIVENRDSVMLSIVSTMDFPEDKETLLNKPEINICFHNMNGTDSDWVYKENEVTTYNRIAYPRQGSKNVYGDFYAIKEGLSIDNVFDQIITDRGHCVETINSTGDSYTIHNNAIGDYEVKYYDVLMKYSADSSYSSRTGMYVFLTTDSYGYFFTDIYSDTDIRLYTNYMDFIIKNLKFTKEGEDTDWVMADYIYD